MTAYAPPVAATKSPASPSSSAAWASAPRRPRPRSPGCPPASRWLSRPMPTTCSTGSAKRAQRAMKCCSKCRWSRTIFPTAIRARTRCAPASSEDANIQRLTWSLTRFTGYAGVTNLLGGRFLADSDALAPVMTFLARRGLYFFDNGPARRSAAPDVAQTLGAPYVQSHVDARHDPDRAWKSTSVFRSWKRTRAPMAAPSARAFSIPSPWSASPTWAKGLQGRGFVLVPASAIVAASEITGSATMSRAGLTCVTRSALSALRRRDAVQPRRAGICRQAHRPDRRRLADAAGRHRRAARRRARRRCAN